METPSKKQRRKENWSSGEIDDVRHCYFEFSSVIEGKLTPSLTGAMKERTWKEISESVNSQGKGSCVRTVEDCKKKLSDMKTEMKKRERGRRQMASMTGGGPAPKLEEWEEKMINLIGESAIGGFPGIDTFRLGTWESGSSATTSSSAAAHSDYVEDPHYMEVPHTDYNVAVAMMPIGAATGEGITTPMDNKTNVERLLERQNETFEQMLKQQQMINNSLLQIQATHIFENL